MMQLTDDIGDEDGAIEQATMEIESHLMKTSICAQCCYVKFCTKESSEVYFLFMVCFVICDDITYFCNCMVTLVMEMVH